MAMVQGSLFGWQEIDTASDLDRLKRVLAAIPDEPFVQFLEAGREKGTNDCPVRPMWNALLAGIVFQHPTVASLIRELRRNPELAFLCGFETLDGLRGIPSEAAFGRFLRVVMKHREWVKAMFDEVAKKLSKDMPELGKRLAGGLEGSKLVRAAGQGQREARR